MDIETRHLPTTQNAESFEFSVIPKHMIDFFINEKTCSMLSSFPLQVQDKFANDPVTQLSAYDPAKSLATISNGQVFTYPYNKEKNICCPVVRMSFNHCNTNNNGFIASLACNNKLSEYLQSLESEKEKFIEYVKSFEDDLLNITLYSSNQLVYHNDQRSDSTKYDIVVDTVYVSGFTYAVYISLKSPDCELFKILQRMASNENW